MDQYGLTMAKPARRFITIEHVGDTDYRFDAEGWTGPARTIPTARAAQDAAHSPNLVSGRPPRNR